MTLGETLADLCRHPYARLIRQWNWKSAVTSTAIRGVLMFTVTLPAGRAAAGSAMVVEMIFRGLSAGFLGSITQQLRFAEPAWAASAAVLLVLPAVMQLLQFAIHWMNHTARLGQGMIASIVFTGITLLFNLYVQRRGALLVGGAEQRSLLADLAAMPKLIFDFVAEPVRFLQR